MKPNTPKSAWQKTRKLFNDIHLWIGLASGIIVILVCLSGTLYVFNTELKEMANPELYKVTAPAGANPMPIESLIKQVKENTGGKVVSVKIPADPNRTYQFMVRMKDGDKEGKGERGAGKDKKGADKGREEHKAAEGKAGKEKGGKPEQGKRPSAFAVNQYTGEVIGNISEVKGATASLMKTMFSLHRWLLLDKVEKPIFGELENRKLGSYITGAATILFTFGVITGMVIWFPQRVKSWRQGLKVKWSGSWKRTNHDLHNSLGFYACIFLFLMGITGPQWSFPWYREALRKTLGTYQPEGFEPPKDPVSTIVTGAAPLNLADYLKKADAALPYTGDYNISLPKDSASAITVMKNKTGFFAPAAGDKVLLDQYTGNVLQKEVFSDKPFNERVSGSIKALHLGDVYGMFTKIIYFLACLIATSLPVTGTLIWLNKLKKKRKKKINKRPAMRLSA
ncbi:PepSY-associated TM helix domain-containing protein [Pedobacter gandavensis]|uniref:PepSY-associated TM helix domain-containing protein n=1 Tax=Pedobacter gandavensis TaxID=2679963 RepID=UPI002478879D|nr:PepSY-associated TM helix domain-containing protein [Pedobacter gandavensis]WGQ08657.1 PepSY-associated TM helix domain-containing protein [Pedobacter gandavensis]